MPPDANITPPAGAMVLRSWIPAASGLIDVLFDRLGAPLDTSFRSLAARSGAAATPKAAVFLASKGRVEAGRWLRFEETGFERP
jgi:hypothetical protein